MRIFAGMFLRLTRHESMSKSLLRDFLDRLKSGELGIECVWFDLEDLVVVFDRWFVFYAQ